MGLEFNNLFESTKYMLETVAGMQDDEHAQRTPARFLKALEELTTPEEFEFTTFPTKRRDMIVIKQNPVTALCAHHVLPFTGYVQVGYIPQERIAGLSKIPRLIRNCGRKLTVQEELTGEIADALREKICTEDIAVIVEAEHLCMTLRGIQAPGVTTRTAVMTGVFADHTRTAKAEFLEAIRTS